TTATTISTTPNTTTTTTTTIDAASTEKATKATDWFRSAIEEARTRKVEFKVWPDERRTTTGRSDTGVDTASIRAARQQWRPAVLNALGLYEAPFVEPPERRRNEDPPRDTRPASEPGEHISRLSCHVLNAESTQISISLSVSNDGVTMKQQQQQSGESSADYWPTNADTINNNNSNNNDNNNSTTSTRNSGFHAIKARASGLASFTDQLSSTTTTDNDDSQLSSVNNNHNNNNNNSVDQEQQQTSTGSSNETQSKSNHGASKNETTTTTLRPTRLQLVLILFHLIVFLIGLIGNYLVCLSVYRNRTLRTVTNYFIVNLAVADFLVILVCLPPTVIWDVTLTWFFGKYMCKLVLYLQSVSVSVSVLTLTFISLDRWYAICYPLKFTSSTSRARLAIFIIWIVSMLVALPDLIMLTTIEPSMFVDDTTGSSANHTASVANDQQQQSSVNSNQSRSIDTTATVTTPYTSAEWLVANYLTIEIDNSVMYTDCNYSWSENETRAYQLCIVLMLFVTPFMLMSVSYFHIIKVLWRDDSVSATLDSMQAQQQLTSSDNKKQQQQLSPSNSCLGQDITPSTKQVTTSQRQHYKWTTPLRQMLICPCHWFHWQRFHCCFNLTASMSANNMNMNNAPSPTTTTTTNNDTHNNNNNVNNHTAHNVPTIQVRRTSNVSSMSDKHQFRLPTLNVCETHLDLGGEPVAGLNSDGSSAESPAELSEGGARQGSSIHSSCDSTHHTDKLIARVTSPACPLDGLASTNTAGAGGRKSHGTHGTSNGHIDQSKLEQNQHHQHQPTTTIGGGGNAAHSPTSTMASEASGASRTLMAAHIGQHHGGAGPHHTWSLEHGKRHSNATQDSSRFCSLIRSRRKAAKMLLAVVIMFGLCYLPVHLINILRYTIGLPQNDLVTTASLVSHWLCYFNSAINPIIYNIMNSKFRHEFSRVFACKCFTKS
ncbi:Orexin receptor type 2, partial [Fragariocoptes setiger]